MCVLLLSTFPLLFVHTSLFVNTILTFITELFLLYLLFFLLLLFQSAPSLGSILPKFCFFLLVLTADVAILERAFGVESSEYISEGPSVRGVGLEQAVEDVRDRGREAREVPALDLHSQNIIF